MMEVFIFRDDLAAAGDSRSASQRRKREPAGRVLHGTLSSCSGSDHRTVTGGRERFGHATTPEAPGPVKD
ncbi:Hypothetical predicted protein [Xyrichtys novacula]|uniref:Uncharacterized protein n=1 Tax=Xyrichtys novacula TaxID=13765 RepID=A0AAV1GU00_XYRNO|nr:Hypothetical predicted protein [Xyrichtys novacula]